MTCIKSFYSNNLNIFQATTAEVWRFLGMPSGGGETDNTNMYLDIYTGTTY